MSNVPPFALNHEHHCFSEDNPASHDKTSDVTLPQGEKQRNKQPDDAFKTLTFSFVYSGTKQHAVAPGIIHIHWIRAVQKPRGSGIIILNNHNQQVEMVNTLKWTSQAIFHKLYQQEIMEKDDHRRTTHYIFYPVLTHIRQ